MQEIKLGRYKHFKGGEYDVLGIARNSETLEDLVLYRHIGDDKREYWVRPLEMFSEKIVKDGKKILRFEFIGD